MVIEQAHKQNNAVIKGMGGTTLVLNKDGEYGLACWELTMYELSLIISEYGTTPEVELGFETLRYHKDSEAFSNQFSVDFYWLKTSILINLFKLNKLTLLCNEKSTFKEIVYVNISKMSKLRKEQLKLFWTDKLVMCKVPVNDLILLNLFNLPGNLNKTTEKDPVLTLALIEKLKKAGETQSELVENLLRSEIFEIPQKLVCKAIFPQ